MKATVSTGCEAAQHLGAGGQPPIIAAREPEKVARGLDALQVKLLASEGSYFACVDLGDICAFITLLCTLSPQQ